jgi:VWFA-related protein
VRRILKRTLTICSCAAILFCFGQSLVQSQDSRNRRVENKDNLQEPQNLDVIKVDANLVSVPVIVSDRQGRYVPDLKAESFKLFDNSNEQKIAYFDAAEEPLNIALLLDTSWSTEDALDKIKKAAKNFIKELRPQDRAMIVSFDFAVHHLSACQSSQRNHARELQSGRAVVDNGEAQGGCGPDDAGLTNDRKVLEKAISKAQVGKFLGTTLNDAVMEVASRDLKNVNGRKAIILLTDGKDHGSVWSTETLLDAEAESDTMVYSISYESNPLGHFRKPPLPGRFPRGIFGRLPPADQRTGSRRQPRLWRSENGEEFLKELSAITAGRFYSSEVTNLNETFAMIAEELRHQYRLGFYPGEIKKDGSVHQLSVKVDAADVAVRARRQYHAQ